MNFSKILKVVPFVLGAILFDGVYGGIRLAGNEPFANKSLRIQGNEACEQGLDQRISCGWPGIDSDTCLLLECCWDGSKNDTAGTALHCFQSRVQSPSRPKRESNDDDADVDLLIAKARRAIAALKRLKERILNARRDYNIAKTVGASVSTAGIFAIIGGIVAAPFTGGLSLGLTIGGVAGTVAGGATTVTTSLIESSKTKEWANELIEPMRNLETQWKATMSEIVQQPGWNTQSIAFSFPSLFDAVSVFNLLDPIREGISIGSAASSSAASFVTATSGTSSSAASFMTASSGASVMSTGATTATTTASAVFSVGGVALGVVGVGLNVYTIVDTWANDPQLAVQIDTLVITWTNIITDLEYFCNQNPDACKSLKEKKCERLIGKMSSMIAEKTRRRKRETHGRMGARTCANIDQEWSRRFVQVDSNTLAAGDGSPINYVGYNWVLNPDVAERFINVVTHVRGEVRREHLRPNNRESFGEDWNHRMDLLGKWNNDVKGHIVGNQLGGPIAWYNLVPMTARLNGNIGNAGGQGMLNVDNLIKWIVEERCGTVGFNFYFNYERDTSVRPWGVRICLQINMRNRNRLIDYYFRNDIL